MTDKELIEIQIRTIKGLNEGIERLEKQNKIYLEAIKEVLRIQFMEWRSILREAIKQGEVK